MINQFDETYHSLISDVLHNGNNRSDRTNTGTLSCFGKSMRFDISTHFPLITTKKVYFKGVVEELLWMLKGDTNAKKLSAKGVKIWDLNGSKEFLKSYGLHYEEGHLGPVYGHQWRFYNAKYVDANTNYKNQGFDQIHHIIESIKKAPCSRRHILNSWNPSQVSEMALPPCHVMCQFYCDDVNNTISCQMYQRSGDIGLGVPFNIASYALLTYIIGYYTGYKPKEFIHVLGDAHIYNNHIESLREQITRNSFIPPKLNLINMPVNFEDLDYKNFELVNYLSHNTIKMSMAV
jgi:thymidylate synthase